MKKLIIFFIFTAVSSINSYAVENELLVHAVEYERIIVNWNPQGNQLATVLAYSCSGCEVKSFVVTTRTQLEDENGVSLGIHQLAEKIDWQGTIKTTNRDPNLITKIMLH